MTSLRWHYPDQVLRVHLSSIKSAPSQNKNTLSDNQQGDIGMSLLPIKNQSDNKFTSSIQDDRQKEVML